MRLTEGQRYTTAILVVVAALLAASLTRFHSPLAELVRAPGPSPTTTVPIATPAPSGLLDLAEPPPTGAPPTPVDLAPTATPSTAPAAGSTGGVAKPPATPCPADDAVQGARKVFEQLDGLLAGAVPSATLTTTVAILSGCSRTDPVVLLLAALVEIGDGLPDLGLGFLELPALPFLTIPAPVVALLQPLLPALQSVCDTVGTVGLLVSQFGPSYPYPLDKAFAMSLFYVTSTCGQLQGL
jgi:hypothetical protein